MKRKIDRLENEQFDLTVIGAGIHGAAIAWDAALRGFKVALIDQGDFGGQTSANSLRLIHGGLRYLQEMNVKRMRESIKERRIMMQIAPHIVRPISCVMPTYRFSSKSRGLMRLALFLTDLVGIDRNRLHDPGKYLPSGRTVGRQELLGMLPGSYKWGLSGGALWFDAMMHNQERLTLSFVKSAYRKNAVVANYVKAMGFVVRNNRVTGVKVVDQLTEKKFTIRSKFVVNAAGPYVSTLTMRAGINKKIVPMTKAFNVVLKRQLIRNVAAGVHRPGRQVFFVVPWRGVSVIGTKHLPISDQDLNPYVSEKELDAFLHEFNRAYPGEALQKSDVAYINSGFLPGTVIGKKKKIKLIRQSQIYDHEEDGHVRGLVSVLGVKYTTARGTAERVVDLVKKKLEAKTKPCQTDLYPLVGGDIPNFQAYLNHHKLAWAKYGWSKKIQDLIFNYGEMFDEVLREIPPQKRVTTPIAYGQLLSQEEVRYAVKEEMAMKLSDVVFRRTALGTRGFPGQEAIFAVAGIMSDLLGWDPFTKQMEIEECMVYFRRFIPDPNRRKRKPIKKKLEVIY